MDRRDRIAQAALAHAGCSAVTDVPRYVDAVIRPADDNPVGRAYFCDNRALSTCGVCEMRFLGLAGCTEPECVAPYTHPLRNAFSDLRNLAARFGAWVSGGMPAPPMQRGDIWIIVNDDGGDGHMGVCVGDAVASASGWLVDTVEGGQLDARGSSTAIGGPFARHFVPRGNRLYLGARYLLGYASADRMPVPDLAATDPVQPAA